MKRLKDTERDELIMQSARLLEKLAEYVSGIDSGSSYEPLRTAEIDLCITLDAIEKRISK